ncbi:TPA: hypothetical protein NZK13_003956 [Pseudomonas aeruginosa]|nr:hypothetical protein [Pseudomonas aeruginosa]HCK3356072.1 hypothetical protein [Pseudomonas aeruginosa]
MRKDLLALPWLTAEQALVVLKDLLGYEISYGDLISQCQHHHCEVFILPREAQGSASTALPLGETDWTTTCRATGPQKVLNPEALAGTRRKVKLYLSGAVLTQDDDEPCRHEAIEWEADIDLDEGAALFQTSAILDLADLITRLSKPLDTRERKSLHQIIAVLASMSGIDLSRPYAPYSAMATEAASLGINLGTDDTVAKHLEAAAATVAP